MNDRFTINEKEEIKIGKTVCDLCYYKNKNSQTICEKYNPIPEEILKNPHKCPWANHNPNAPW